MKNLSLLLGLLLTLSFSVLSPAVNAADSGTIGVGTASPFETQSYVVNRDRRHDSASALLLQVVDYPVPTMELADTLIVVELGAPIESDRSLVGIPDEPQQKIK